MFIITHTDIAEQSPENSNDILYRYMAEVDFSTRLLVLFIYC